jgi:uncharacterized protein (DUF2062 family)
VHNQSPQNPGKVISTLAGRTTLPPLPLLDEPSSSSQSLFRMPRKFLARYLPDADALRHLPGFRYLGRYIQDPRFFHLNRHSVAGAAAIGAFLAFIPIIGQTLIAAILAMWMRVNVIIAVAAVWISNPVPG